MLLKPVLDIGVFVVTVLMMVTVGMELPTRHFREVPRSKYLILSLIAIPSVLLPALAYLLIRVLSLPAWLSAGILLVAACPVGDIANFYILLARGNAVLTFLVNTLTCLLSSITMWLIFQGYHLLPSTSFDFVVPPTALVGRITLMAALPVLTGIALQRFTPRLVKMTGKHLRNISFAGVGLLLVYILAKQQQQLAQQWRQTAVAAAIFMTLAMSVGLSFGSLLRLNPADRFSAGVIFAVRNVGLAMAISVTLLNRVDYAVFAAVYFITEVPVLLAAVGLYRLWRRKYASLHSTAVSTEPTT